MNEYSASTLQEVLQLASEDKNVAVSDLKYTIVSQDENNVTINAYCLDDIKEFLFNYLGAFFSEVDPNGIEIEISINKTEESFTVLLNSDYNAAYIGKNGARLKAINEVAKAAILNTFKHHYSVLVDINNYKKHRYSRVVYAAKQAAKQVQQTKVSASLDPMPNDERKAIHKALQNWHNLSTQSEGVGDQRHIVLSYVEDEQVEQTPEVEEEESEFIESGENTTYDGIPTID